MRGDFANTDNNTGLTVLEGVIRTGEEEESARQQPLTSGGKDI